MNLVEDSAIYEWNELEVGMAVSVPFCISKADMETFAALSADHSRIHKDADFARLNGFSEPVVYGALTIARLSNLVGMHLPGDLGLATSWQIDFNRPLYVDEEAVFEGHISHISEATQTVKIRFKVFATPKNSFGEPGETKLIASGSAGSKILEA